MKLGEIVYAVFAVSTLGLYGFAERQGWATGGDRKPPIPQEQLRSNAPGSWNYVYWHHGSFGK